MAPSRRAIPMAALALVWISTPALPPAGFASIYTYTDDNGIQTFTNRLESVPEQYRNRLTPHESDALPVASVDPPRAATEPPARSADSRIVTAGGEYRLGDHDTRTDGVRLAVEAAKKDALEQVATYLESVTEVRDMHVTRDDIRSYTAGIVTVLDERITTRVEHESIVIRAELTAAIDPHEVAQAIASLRENESAMRALMELRAETDRLQEQLDATNRALAAAPSADEVQLLSRQREDMLNELQANGFMSQAWTSMVYAMPGFYSYPWIGISGINGLLLQAQRLSPRHRHLPLAQQMVTTLPRRVPPIQPGVTSAPRPSLLVPSAPHARHQAPPLLNPQGLPAKVGDIVVIPTPRSVPPALHQSAPQPQPYQLHPNHFWRPSPPNIRSAPSIPPPRNSVSPQLSGTYRSLSGGSRAAKGR